MNRKLILALMVLTLATIFCTIQPNAVSTPSDGDVASAVSATLTAMASVPSGSVETPSDVVSTTPMSAFPETGYISGRLSYPSSFLPAMRVVAWSVTDGSYSYVDTMAGQFDYTIEVPVGQYYVVSYSLGEDGFPSGLAGGYTQMVPCGLAYGCDDHTLIPVIVTAGATTANIDPGDWYADPMAFPDAP